MAFDRKKQRKPARLLAQVGHRLVAGPEPDGQRWLVASVFALRDERGGHQHHRPGANGESVLSASQALVRARPRNPFVGNFVGNFVGFRPLSTKFATKFPTKFSENGFLGQALVTVATRQKKRRSAAKLQPTGPRAVPVRSTWPEQARRNPPGSRLRAM